MLYWTTQINYELFSDFVLPFIFVYYLIEPKAFIDYDLMQITGKQTPKEGWPKAIAMFYAISKTVLFDTAYLEDPYGHDLEINVNTFIYSYLINSWAKPILFEVIGIPLMIWTEISIAYQMVLLIMGAPITELSQEEENFSE